MGLLPQTTVLFSERTAEGTGALSTAASDGVAVPVHYSAGVIGIPIHVARRAWPANTIAPLWDDASDRFLEPFL